MKSSIVDPRKLLGFRVLLAEAQANGKLLDMSDSRLGEKLSTKVGAKLGNKDGLKA